MPIKPTMHYLCPLKEIRRKQPKRFLLPDGSDIIVVRTWRGLYAIENRCPHAGAPLHDSRVHRQKLTCLWHGYSFSLESGNCLDDNISGLRFFPLEIIQKKLYIRLENTPENANI